MFIYFYLAPQVPVYSQQSKGGIDPRYSATYGNPYLRNSSAGKFLMKKSVFYTLLNNNGLSIKL